MRAKILALLFAFCLVPAVHAREAATPVELGSTLSKHVENYDLGSLNFVEALIRASSDFEIPMGIAWVDIPAARATRRLVWKDATVQEIIQAIVNTQPGYQLELRNGVAHVSLPSIPERENFLAIRLKSFAVHNQYSELASLKLHNLITPPSYAGISVGGDIEPKITLELENPTVQDALDAIIVNSAKKIWVVTFIDGGAPTRAGFRRSRSIWSDSPGLDKHQPAWDFLHWGDKLPPLRVDGTPLTN